jgi:hypothetical protein
VEIGEGKLMADIHNEYCKSCVYCKGVYFKFCDYRLIAGKGRPCPAGEGCTVRKLKEGTASMKPPGRPPAFDKDIALNFYNGGMSDKEIAEPLGVAENKICNWRTKAKLPINSSHKAVNASLSPEDHRFMLSIPLKAEQTDPLIKMIAANKLDLERGSLRLELAFSIITKRA